METKYALNLSEDGRILSVTYPQYAPADAVIVDALPDGDVTDYIYTEGGYTYDPLPVEEPEEPSEPQGDVWAEMAMAIKRGVATYD